MARCTLPVQQITRASGGFNTIATASNDEHKAYIKMCGMTMSYFCW